MSDQLSPLDLKFLPDWLKETPSANKYATFQGESEGRFDRSSRGPSRGGAERGRGGNERRGDRPDRGNRNDGGNRRPGSPGGSNRSGDRQSRHGDRRDHHRGPATSPAHRAHFTPPQFKVEFLPEEGAAASIANQIRQSSRAYPLFGTARLFLEKPERHFIRVTSSDPSKPLFQFDNGPVSFERDLVVRNAFRQCRDRFYREEVREIEAPKGNYTSVARCRSSGILLGPTNHHAYQVAIRKLYEERFSRRMSFVQFQKEEIEVISSEQAVADWKEQASKQTVYHTTSGTEQLEFKSLQEVESHFNKTYLESLVKSATSLDCSGKAARDLPERFLSTAAREAFERELAYPASLVHGLRPYFNEQNLHVFKHRKRVLYLSAVRPKPVTSSNEFADGPATLLTVIGESPRISKRDLAIKILGTPEPDAPESPELATRKTQLAADLHYLVHTGLVIEFADGKLDLPLSPAAQAASEAANSEDSAADQINSDPAVQTPAEPEDEKSNTENVCSSERPLSVQADMSEVSEISDANERKNSEKDIVPEPAEEPLATDTISREALVDAEETRHLKQAAAPETAVEINPDSAHTD
jgi:hypothetical protein